MSSSGNALPVVTKIHEFDGGRALDIMINRPEVHNCVDGPTAELLLEAWTRFRDDDSLTVAVFHGAGEDAFCSGADLAALATLVDPSVGLDAVIANGTGPMGGTRIVQTKPVITVSQGHTYAGGLELFCHGHIRIAEEAARFSVACRRWGVPLVDGGTVLLPRLIGLGHALPLIITGQRIDAQRAREIGLVWEVTPPGKGSARALDVARQICAVPRDALWADLRSSVLGMNLPLEEAFKLEAESLRAVLATDSMAKGVETFLSGQRFWFT